MIANRRDVLKQLALLMGGTVSASTILAIEKGYAAANPTSAAPHKPGILTPPQMSTVSAIADVIIPRTDTPGALDVGVPNFIDLMVKDVFAPKHREHYLTGLAEFDATARSEQGKEFVALDQEHKIALVRKFQDAAISEEKRLGHPQMDLPRPFMLTTKELTLLGFFTSQAGATQVLQYVAVPGAYHACIPINQAGNGKSWAVLP